MKAVTRAVIAKQNSVNQTNRQGNQSAPFMAQVVSRYSDRMTCDVKTIDGFTIKNVPMLSDAGLADGKPYGTLSMPNVDDWVIVSSGGYGARQYIIIGSVVPYLTNEFTDNAVNSDDKQFSLKLLEEDKSDTYRKIFKSGTTIEVDENGSVVLETPSGMYAQLDEENGEIILKGHMDGGASTDGPFVKLTPDSIEISDVYDYQSKIVITSGTSLVITGINDNTITMNANGIIIEDVNGNDVTMGVGKVTINGYLEVLQ